MIELYFNSVFDMSKNKRAGKLSRVLFLERFLLSRYWFLNMFRKLKKRAEYFIFGERRSQSKSGE